MKRHSRLIRLPILFCLSIMPLAELPADEFAGGSGTADDPWRIATPAHLDRLRNYLGHWHGDRHFLLVADIDLGLPPWNEGGGWVPIGSVNDHATEFSGTLDGGGHVIRNLTIDRPGADNQGLFSSLNQAVVRRLVLEGVDIQARQTAGVLAAVGYGVFESIAVSGRVSAIYSYAGGLLGMGGGRLLNIAVEVAVEGRDRVGGVVGSGSGEMRLVSASGTVGAESLAGGLPGTVSGTVNNCFSRATVTGDHTLGGLVGQASNVFFVTSFSVGAVSGTGSHLGGLLGRDRLSTCVSLNSYWDTEASGRLGSAAGEGRTTEQLQCQDTFEGFNFDVVWRLEGDGEYPALQDVGGFAPPQAVSLAELPGSGVPEDPWRLSTPDELNAIRQTPGGHFQLANDIDMSATVVWDVGRGWQPLDAFSGTLDGAGHIVSGLHISRPRDSGQGLIARAMNGSLIQDLHLEGVDMSVGSESGMLVGSAGQATIRRASVAGSLIGVGARLGGLIGWIDDNAHIEHCVADVRIWVFNNIILVGGLIGESGSHQKILDVVVEGSRASGTLWLRGRPATVGGHDVTAGGLAGRVYGNTILLDCHASVDVFLRRFYGYGTRSLGGLAGCLGNQWIGRLRHSSASGRVDALQSAAGGLVGRVTSDSDGTIVECYASGDVVCRNGSELGGLIGVLENGRVENSYARGNVISVDRPNSLGV